MVCAEVLPSCGHSRDGIAEGREAGGVLDRGALIGAVGRKRQQPQKHSADEGLTGTSPLPERLPCFEIASQGKSGD